MADLQNLTDCSGVPTAEFEQINLGWVDIFMTFFKAMQKHVSIIFFGLPFPYCINEVTH